ncbi:MAG: hypothetical protein Q4F97_11105 [Bacteroidales bacterium]|nr:hypothetical protein [Bacteroidales bacterium]
MRNIILFLIFASIGANVIAQEINTLKPVISKDLLDIKYINPELNDFKDNNFITKMAIETKFNELKPMVNKGMTINGFTRVPLNIYNSNSQVYIFKTSDGSLFTIINRQPLSLNKDISNPNDGFGTAIGGMDFNKILYYASHPKAKAKEERTAYYRTLITNVVYPIN